MKYLSNKKGFLGIDNKSNSKDSVIVIPFGLEKTVSYGGGTSKGPKEIIKASHQVELFDEDLNCEPYKKIGIKTIKPFPIKKNIKDAINQIAKINDSLLNQKLFPLVLGGEHSITSGCIIPFVQRYKNVCLLHFDAHADLRESYNNNVISFGIRNISAEETSYLKKNNKRIKIFWAKDKDKWNLNLFKKLIKNKTVYLTFDVDGFDSSVMAATGTPEPGGLFWDETIKIIKIAAKNSKIVGADVNELKEVGILVFGQDQYGGSMLMLPIEDVCKNSDGVEGIILNLFFIKKKLLFLVLPEKLCSQLSFQTTTFFKFWTSKKS